MYTVNQGPSKLVAKTRTGLSQNYEKIESIRKNNNKVNGAQNASKSNNGITIINSSNGSSAQSSSTAGGDCLNNKDMNINVAKPVFQQYRRSNSSRSNNSFKNGFRITCFKDEEPEPILSPQYEELIRYMRDSWNVLSAECEAANEHQATATAAVASSISSISSSSSSSSSMSSTSSSSMTPSTSNSNDSNHVQPKSSFKRTKKVILYHNDPPSPALQDFGAFDLESWWGRRLFNNITKSL